jgi:hypothetical protein
MTREVIALFSSTMMMIISTYQLTALMWCLTTVIVSSGGFMEIYDVGISYRVLIFIIPGRGP